MKHVILFAALLLVATYEDSLHAQTFFNTDTNSGVLIETMPGQWWYSDEHQHGFITQTMPGQVMIGLTGENGRGGQFGFATDLSPREDPELFKPLPHYRGDPASIYEHQYGPVGETPYSRY